VLSQEIAKGQLALHYRPHVLLSTDQIVAWEAELYRPAKDDRDEELISEASLEEGLAQQLFRHLVDEACHDFQRSLARRHPSESLVVRISQRHLLGATAVISVATALEQSKLPAERLEVDVTATGSIQDPAALLEPLLQLHHLGVRLSLSSLATSSLPLEYLPNLPVSSMTLPEQLWRRSLEDRKTASLCEGLVALAERLGLSVNAAGITSHSERKIAQERGCQRGHGPLWPLVRRLPGQDS
jgi:EAL domain-containing protein (putative c-di-GMP-specific phosphodiesterase class I)